MNVEGYCPMGCGQTLVLGDRGHVACSLLGCPDPAAVDKILAEREIEHIVVFSDVGFDAQHPLRERIDGELFDCEVAKRLRMLDEAPVAPGRYRVTLRESDAVSDSRRSNDVGLNYEALPT